MDAWGGRSERDPPYVPPPTRKPEPPNRSPRDLGFDQTPEYDPGDPDPVPDFEFDQPVADEFN